MHEAAKRRLVAELVEAGRRTAKQTNCARCGAPVIRGEDHDAAAATVNVDIDPLDQAAEMLTLLAGRATYDLLRLRGKGRQGHGLYIREPWHYQSSRDYGGTVHALHRCAERNP